MFASERMRLIIIPEAPQAVVNRYDHPIFLLPARVGINKIIVRDLARKQFLNQASSEVAFFPGNHLSFFS